MVRTVSTLTRLDRIAGRLYRYEQQRPLTLAVQRKAVEGLHDDLESLERTDCTDNEYRLIAQLREQAESLLQDCPIQVNEPSPRGNTSMEESPRERKAIDTRGILRFDGRVLTYPEYRASVYHSILSLPHRSDHEKYVAILRTIDHKVKTFLVGIDPTQPDLNRVMQLLDDRYLSSRASEMELKQEISRLPNVNARSSEKDWDELNSAVSKLLLRVQSGDLNSTAERDVYHLILQKLSETDQEAVALQGKTMRDLAIKMEQFVVRAQVYTEKRGPLSAESKPRFDPRPYNSFKYNRPAPWNRPRPQTHTVIASACLFCGKLHSMKDCPAALNLKQRKVRELKRCWRCLAPWQKDHRCGQLCSKCNDRHHISLCPRLPAHEAELKSDRPAENRTFLTGARSSRLPCYLPSLRMSASGGNGQSLGVRVLLDPGSTTSYVSQTLATALGTELREIPSQPVYAFGGTTRFLLTHETTLTLQTHVQTASVDLLVMPPNCISPIDVPTEPVATKAQRLGVSLDVSSSPLEEVDILLGVPLLNQLVVVNPQHSVQLEGNLLAIESKFGWYVQGITNEASDQVTRTFLTQSPSSECMCSEVDQLLRDPLSSKAAGDISSEQWIINAMASVTYDPKEKRWMVPLPWLNEARPDNNRSAVYRATEYQLKKTIERGLRAQYDEAISQYLHGDFAEQVQDNPAKAYYITHHSVMKPGSTTAMRIVMNASFSRKGERSLNDVLYKGFTDQNNLMSLLLLWRLHPYAVTADLQKAFLQVRIRPEDRPFVRYFWAPSGTTRLQTYQMKSVLFGATASPCLLYLVLRKMFESAPEVEVRNLYQHFYMDDCMFLGDDASTVRRQISAARRILTEGSFTIHKWACPNWMVQQGFETEESKQVVKCLGLLWNLTEDNISFGQPEINCLIVTRREVTRIFGRLFDPHGLLGPFHTRQKLFIRKVFEQTKGWDAPLDKALADEAQARFQELSTVGKIKLPRAVRTQGPYELIGFADASRSAYGAVLYLKDASCEKMCVLISRSRLVSEKRTIPELELCAAVLLVELYTNVRTDLSAATAVTFYTDSTVTLGRIRNNPNNYPQYVARRLALIAKDTSAEQWRHVPTKLNPADALSRGLSLSELEADALWFDGPDVQQLRAVPEQTFHTNALPTVSSDQAANLDAKLLDMSYEKLIRFLVAYYRVMKDQLQSTGPEGADDTSLDRLATAAAWRLYQRVVFPKEVACLKEGRPLPRSSSLANLNVTLGPRGIIRLNRRLENAPLSYDAQFPIVATDHPFVRSFLDYFHAVTMCHASRTATDQQVKNVLYLPQHYELIRSVLTKCPKCQWLHGKTFNAPPAALPTDRVFNESQHPFLHIGVDLFGPLESGAKKFYGMLFACMNTRAVHLELLPSRTTTSILRAFERFVSRRGRPQIVRSDNEKGFRQLGPLLRELFDQDLRERVETDYKLVWRFQPAQSPFWGGFFERLVGVVKKAFANWPLIRRYNSEELTTILCSVEALVNSRPLIAATTNTEYLTPAHFLIGRPSAFAPPLPLDPPLPANDVLLNYVRLCEERDAIWTRLKREYLINLRHFHRRNATREPEVNELVLIVGPWKREAWHWGKVKKLMRGPDGVVRAVTLEMPNGETWERPVQSLIPLEASSQMGGCGELNVATESAPSTSSLNAPRSTPPREDHGNKSPEPAPETTLRRSKRQRVEPSRLRF